MTMPWGNSTTELEVANSIAFVRLKSEVYCSVINGTHGRNCSFFFAYV